MHIKFRVGLNEWEDAAMLELRRRTKTSALEYFGPHAVAIIWIAASLIPNPANDYLNDPTDLLLTLGVIPIFMGYLLLRKKRFQQDYRKIRNAHLLQNVDIDGEGLRVVTTDGALPTTWKDYTKFAEDGKVFILFRRGVHGFMPIPKSYLTMLQVDELRSLLQARLPQG